MFQGVRFSWPALALLASLLALASCATPSAEAPPSSAAAEATTAQAASAPQGKINLNGTTSEELIDAIPNFGSRMAEAFLEYQPYASIQHFRREIGQYVSAEQVAVYEEYVFVPVNVNKSDAETLKQIPGVDYTVTEVLMASRPYASNDAFLAVLSDHLSAEQLEIASAYLAAAE